MSSPVSPSDPSFTPPLSATSGSSTTPDVLSRLASQTFDGQTSGSGASSNLSDTSVKLYEFGSNRVADTVNALAIAPRQVSTNVNNKEILSLGSFTGTLTTGGDKSSSDGTLTFTNGYSLEGLFNTKKLLEGKPTGSFQGQLIAPDGFAFEGDLSSLENITGENVASFLEGLKDKLRGIKETFDPDEINIQTNIRGMITLADKTAFYLNEPGQEVVIQDSSHNQLKMSYQQALAVLSSKLAQPDEDHGIQ